MKNMQNNKIILGTLKNRSEFLFVRNGKSIAKHGLVIQARKNPERENGIKIGFTASKKIGNAVIRNRAKRRLRALAWQVLPELGRAGFDYVFIARVNTVNMSWQSLLKHAQKALSTIN